MRKLLALLFIVGAAVATLRAQRGPANAEVTPIVERQTVTPGSTVRAALQVKLPEGYHTNSNKPRDPNLIPVSVTFDPLPAGVSVDEVVFPPAKELVQRGADQPLLVFEAAFNIGIRLKIASDAAAGPRTVVLGFKYQACDEVACYAPKTVVKEMALTIGAPAGAPEHVGILGGIAFGKGEPPRVNETATLVLPKPVAPPMESLPSDDIAALARFDEAGTTTGYLSTADFQTFIRNAEQGIREKGMFEGRGPLAILLLVLIGGLALNLTPCVLPMIPINLAIIGAGAKAGSGGRGFLLGAVYGGAMAFVYGVLGLIVILTASTFGTINASPWFNLGIAILFVVLALAMFDIIVIDFSTFSSNIRFDNAGRGSFLVAFGMGAVAALLAGACVAPVVIQVVLFSSNLYATGTTAALALPFMLGVGMAIPWPFAGAGIAALPKPGAWMVRIKQVFGVIILVTAAYYGYEAYSLFANRWVDAGEVQSSVAEKVKEGWHASLSEGLAVAAREKKPVLIDMWATWCKNCLVMDKTTLQDPAVTSALSNYVKIKFQAEDPDGPQVSRVMNALGAKGLPTYVILKPRP